MREDKSTDSLEVRRQRCVSTVNVDDGGQKHAPTKGGVSTVNTDEGEIKHAWPGWKRGCEYGKHG